MPEALFTNDLFRFLKDLKRHNDRAWFAENKERYLEAVQEPAPQVRGLFVDFGVRTGRHVSSGGPALDERPYGG